MKYTDSLGNKHDSQAELLLACQLIDAGIEFECQYKAIPKRRFKFDFRVGKFLIEINGGMIGTPRKFRGRYYVPMMGHNSADGIRRDIEKTRLAIENGFIVLPQLPEHIKSGVTLEFIKGVTGYV